jgi:hypothetical protein
MLNSSSLAHAWRLVLWLCLALASLSGPAQAAPVDAADLSNASCLSCHESKKKKIAVAGTDDEMRSLAPVHESKFGKSVHAQMQCVDCHVNIVDSKAQHEKAGDGARPDCAGCHTELWQKAQAAGKQGEKPRLGVVAENVEAYKKSFHARPNEDDDTRPNATCHECHNSHEFSVPLSGSEARAEWRLTVPEVCGSKCHQDQLEEYAASVHGQAVLEKKDGKAAVCDDCHTSHAIGATATSPVRLAITEKCGNCHEDNLRTYRATYHGQVGALGHAYTAKCFDCHGSHGVLKADNPDSTIHKDNLLDTCRNCHTDKKEGMRTATAGFVSFGPHAHGGDFEKYPQMWIATKFMVGLLIGVFAFFWLHSGLWYYREWKDRKEGKRAVHVRTEGLDLDERKHFRRFHLGWRIAHLVFALVTMTLVLTGTSALFAGSSWAPVVSKALGGPKMLGLIHRVAAGLFIGIFVIHFVYVRINLQPE